MKPNFSPLSEALSVITSHSRVFIQGGVATPEKLISGLLLEAPRLENVEILHLHTVGEAAYARPEYRKSFFVKNLFVGANMRKQMNFENVDYLPCFLSEIPQLFRRGLRKPDVALIHVSPPDRHGYCSLGTSVDVTRAAIDTAQFVIAQVNERMPRTHGDGLIHMSSISHFVEAHGKIPEAFSKPLSDIELKIGQKAAELIENGATLQMGIGSIPDAVLASLTHHKDLGIHTEMWSDGALPLFQKGVITNSRKKIHPGKTVSSFVTGTQALYDYINDNPSVVLLDVSYVNAPAVIARNPKVTAINSAVEVDLTGQVCADSVGRHIISGVGGQIDFMRGASISEGGRPIIAMTSRTQKGKSRLVSSLTPGAGVVTTRAHVHFVVTEFGAVDLFGLSLGERSKALISIAHPDDRENLSRQWHDEYC